MKILKLQSLLVAVFFGCVALNTNANDEQAVVIALGTQGGPQPNPFRAQPAHALQVNGEVYLVDAGNGVARQLEQSGINAEAVKKIFITHNHDDHNADLGTLMGLSWSLSNRDDFKVFGPLGIEQVIKGFLQSYSVNSAIRSEDTPIPRLGKFEGDIDIHSIDKADKKTRIFEDDNVVVFAIENCHYHHDDPVETQSGVEKSFAYRFESKHRTVVFSGDTGPCEQLVEFSKGADVLVHEVFSTPLMEDNIRSNGLMSAIPSALIRVMLKKSEQYHTVPEQVGRLAQAAGVGMVVLTHVMPGRESDPDEAYTSGVSKYYSGQVVLAEDLQRF